MRDRIAANNRQSGERASCRATSTLSADTQSGWYGISTAYPRRNDAPALSSAATSVESESVPARRGGQRNVIIGSVERANATEDQNDVTLAHDGCTPNKQTRWASWEVALIMGISCAACVVSAFSMVTSGTLPSRTGGSAAFQLRHELAVTAPPDLWTGSR